MATSSKRKIEMENRKFNIKWIENYFVHEQNSKVVCLICNAHICTKEFNVKRHYDTKHQDYKKFTGNLRNEKIKALQRGIASQQNMFKKLRKEAEIITEISYDISLLICKASRPFTEGEFVKSCLVTATKKMCPDEIAKQFESISLGRNTVQRRITEMSDNIYDQLKKKSNDIWFYSLAVDESTDICSTAQFMIFYRAVTADFEIFEELLGISALQGRTTGAELLSNLLLQLDKAGLDLNKLAGITTDGAPSMIGKNIGMVSLLKNKLEARKREIFQFHCIIHQQNLCGKDLGMDHVMKVVVTAVNFIKNRGLNHRQFKAFLSDIEAEYQDLIYYCEVRWLSRGKTLQRFSELIEEIKTFLSVKNKLIKELTDDSWLCDFAFLVDITSHLNDLNSKLQGKNQFISEMANHVESFQKKLELFQKNFSNGIMHHFPTCQNYFPKYSGDCKLYVPKITLLCNIFKTRFTDFKKFKNEFKLLQDPFSVTVDDVPEELQLELLDLQSCTKLQNIYKEGDINKFYKSIPRDKYPNIIENAALLSCLFGSTYICEQTFSIMNLNKSKQRNRLSDENLHAILRLATTKHDPDISKLVGEKQCHS